MSAHQKTQAANHPVKAEKAKKSTRVAHKPVNAAQMLEAPETLRTDDVLAAQKQVGNQVVQRALDKNANRKRVTDDQGNLVPEITGKIQSKRGHGTPLPENIRKDASQKLKQNFKNVRLHTDDTADTLSRTINARAFTIGNDIFFKRGVFAPGTSAGRETLIHELTHVVQQGGKAGSGKLKLGGPDTAHEKEADHMGKKHASTVSQAPTGAVQRAAEEDELQMQGEEDELQMQSEEDELQMQGEEDELQMQSDEDKLQMPSESPDPDAAESPMRDEEAKMQTPANSADSDTAESPMVNEEAKMQTPANSVDSDTAESTMPDEEAKMQTPANSADSDVAESPMPGEEAKTPAPSEVAETDLDNDDDEVKAQPDAGGIVQRSLQDDLQKKILERKQLGSRKVQNEAFDKIDEKNSKNSLNKKTLNDAKIFSLSAKNKEAALGAKRSELGIGSEKNLKHLSKLEKKQDENFKAQIGGQLKEEQKGKAGLHRSKLMTTIQNPKSSPEEAKAAQEKLDSLFKLSKKEKLKRAFSKDGMKSMWRRKSLSLDPSKEAMFDRKKNLKKAARAGDEDAFKNLNQMKEDKKKAEEEKKNAPSPVKDFLKDKVGGFVKKKLFGGDKDKDDEKGGSGVTVNLNGVSAAGGGGGNDSSIATIMQQYAQVVEENKKLKEELAKKNPA